MKKKVFSLMMTLVLAFMGMARAEVVTIGDPTATTVSSYLPGYSLYEYSLTQQIYTADEIGVAGTINSLTMWLKNSSSYARNLEIYMKEVTESSFANGSAWVSFAASDLVATSTLNNGISESVETVFTLSTPFNYSGSANLVICVRDVTGSWSSGVAGVTMAANGFQSIYAYRDGTTYDVANPGVTGTTPNNLKNVIALDITAGETPGGGGSSDPEIGLHVRYDNGEEGRELVIDDLYLGEYPAGAWMEPFHFEMYNDDTQALTVSVLDFTPNTDALSMAEGTELPFTVAGNSSEYIDLAIQVQAPADAEAGDYEYQFVAIYEGSRLAKIWPLSFTIYTPEIPDVVEKAYDLGTIADGYTYTGVPSEITPTVLHNDYTLPFPEIPEGNDAVYKFKVEGDMIISAYVDEANADGKVALYTEDFYGEAGPMATNNYTGLTRSNANRDVILTQGFEEGMGEWTMNNCNSYTGIYTGASAANTGGCSFRFRWTTNPPQYLISPELADNNGGTLSFYCKRDGDYYVESYKVGYSTTTNNPSAFTFGPEVQVTSSTYIEQTATFPAGTKYIAIASTGYDTYFLFIDDITIDVENAGGGGGTVSPLANVSAGPVIEDLPIQAGTYYLVASSTDADYTVHINAADMPCPAIDAPGFALNPYPADDQDSIQPASVTLSWTNPEYATGWRLVFGSTYYPEAGHPQTVIYPEDGSFSTDMANSYTVTNLWNNTNYFWHVEFNNTACADGVSSPIWGFTTTFNAPQNLVANPEELYEGETTTLTWDAIVDRTYRTYRVYKDGVMIHETQPTPNPNVEANLSWTVPASELTYNMTGYTFNVTAVYDEGESPFSNDAVVMVSGYSAEPGIYGYVYEQDSVTPIGGVTVTVTGLDEFGNAVNYSATTDNNGYYTMHPVLAGKYNTAFAYCAGYQDAEPYTNIPPFTLPYQGTWGEMNFIMQEEFYPSPLVCAEVVQVGEDELVKVWWQIPDGTGGTGTGDFLSEYEAQIGTGTQTTGYVPFYTLYDNSVSLSLYTADELTAAGATPAPMRSISWQASNQTGYAQQGITIWMANVTDAQAPLTTPATTGMTKVYTGGMTPVSGWNEFAFNAGEFAWDGTSNLLILVQRNNGTWNSTVNWNGQAAPNMVSYKYQDGTAFDVENTPVTGMSNTTNVRPNIILKGGTRADRADRAMHHYRIYRTDCYYDGPYYEGDPGGTIVLASAWVPDTAYFDVSWPDAAPGVYKWGVGVVYEGNQADNPNNPRGESQINWAAPMNNMDIASAEVTPYASNEPVMAGRAMWDLLGSFEAAEQAHYGVATDGTNLYTSNWGYSSATHNFYKYDMQGNMIEGFEIAGCGTLRGMTYDGQYFYGVANSSTVYCVDLANHTLVSQFNSAYGAMRCITYDPVRDGFWVVGNWSGDLTLIDRTGAIVQVGPTPQSASDVAYYEDEENVEHVLVYCQPGGSGNALVFDYNIATNTLGAAPIFDVYNNLPGVTSGSSGGAFVGDYNGKTAFFANIQQSPNLIGIFELKEGTVTPTPTPTPGVNNCDNLLALPRESCTAWSNECSPCIDKDMEIEVSVNVLLNSADSPEGTTVGFTNLNAIEQAMHPQDMLTLDDSGYHLFDSFRRGTYAIEVRHEGYYTIHDTVNIGFDPNDTRELRYVMTEILYPVRDLYISRTGWAMWERESGWEDGEPTRHFNYYKVMCTSIDGEPIFNKNTEHPFCQVETAELVEGNYYICKVACMFTTGMSAWTEQVFQYEPCDHWGPVDFVNADVNSQGNHLVWQFDHGHNQWFDPNDPDNPVGGEGDTFSVNFDDSQMPAGWTIIDNGNPAGYGWQLASNKIGTGNGHNGSTDCILSQSYDNSYGVVYPDNWFISPAVTLANGSTFSLWACGQDAGYSAEHFGVFVSTTGTNPSDFTMVNEWTIGAKSDRYDGPRGTRDQSTWTQYVVDLSAYAGTGRYIAIRHFSCSDMFYLDVDDVTLTAGRSNNSATNISMMQSFKNEPVYRQYANDGIMLNFLGINNADFRLFLLYNLVKDNRFVMVPDNDYGQFIVSASDEAADLGREFESFYANVEADYAMLTKNDIAENHSAWKSFVAPNYYTSIMMDMFTNSIRVENDRCINSLPFCTTDLIEFETSIGDQTADALEGVTLEDGCIGMNYNPSWYHLRIQTGGPFIIHMEGHDPNNPSTTRDVDFCIWGPFSDPYEPCVDQLTTDKIIDCSFSASYTEDIYLGYPEGQHDHGYADHGTISNHVPQVGEYYIMMLTNYSRQPCVMSFTKTEGEGETDCDIVVPTNIIGFLITQDGEYLDFVGPEVREYTHVGEFGGYEYCVRPIYPGPAILPDTNYYWCMGCPVCVSTNSGEVICEANFTINGEYFWNNADDFGARLWWGEDGGDDPTPPDPVGGEGDTFTINFDDSQIPAGWTIIDNGNPAGYGWQLASEKIGTGNGHNGSTDCILSQSYDNNYGVVYPDNWFISPAVTLANGSTFSLWACGQDAGYSAEHFGVFVSTTGTNPSDFTMVNEWTIGAKSDRYDGPRGTRDQSTWTQYVVDLSAYAGTGRYIAIRHFSCSDMFYLDVDDLELSNGRNREGVVLYNIYRSTDNVNYELIDTVEAEAGVTEYEYIDNTAEAGVTYYYQVTAVYDNDCESTPALVEGSNVNYVVVGVTAIGENTGKVALYPNPTSGNVKIEANGMRHITVVSSLGQVVYDADVKADEMDLNMGQFTTGVYMVRIVTESGIHTQRVTVVR